MTSTSGLIGNFGQANYSAAKLGIAALSKSIALDMQKFGVRSNAVAPFAWTRMIDSIPITSRPSSKARGQPEEAGARTRGALRRGAVCRRGADVTGQIFGVRNNEIFLFSQPRPVRNAHNSEGWTPQSIRHPAAGGLHRQAARWTPRPGSSRPCWPGNWARTWWSRTSPAPTPRWPATWCPRPRPTG
jgi:hypothetical protein